MRILYIKDHNKKYLEKIIDFTFKNKRESECEKIHLNASGRPMNGCKVIKVKGTECPKIYRKCTASA